MATVAACALLLLLSMLKKIYIINLLPDKTQQSIFFTLRRDSSPFQPRSSWAWVACWSSRPQKKRPCERTFGSKFVLLVVWNRFRLRFLSFRGNSQLSELRAKSDDRTANVHSGWTQVKWWRIDLCSNCPLCGQLNYLLLVIPTTDRPLFRLLDDCMHRSAYTFQILARSYYFSIYMYYNTWTRSVSLLRSEFFGWWSGRVDAVLEMKRFRTSWCGLLWLKRLVAAPPSTIMHVSFVLPNNGYTCSPFISF